MRFLKDLLSGRIGGATGEHPSFSGTLLGRLRRGVLRAPLEASLVAGVLLLMAFLPFVCRSVTGGGGAPAERARSRAEAAEGMRRSSPEPPPSRSGKARQAPLRHEAGRWRGEGRRRQQPKKPPRRRLAFLGSWQGVEAPQAGPRVARWMVLRAGGSVEILQGGYLAKGSWQLIEPTRGGANEEAAGPHLRIRFRFFGNNGAPLGSPEERVFVVEYPADPAAPEPAGRTGGPRSERSAGQMRLVDPAGRAFVYRRLARR